MLNETSTTAIVRIVLLAGIMLALAFLASRSFFPAFAQEGPIEYDENSIDPVAVYTGTDPEGEEVKWDVMEVDEEDFSIDENGVLSFVSPPNYEAPTDRRGTGDNGAQDRLYEITVRAHDGTIGEADTKITPIIVFVKVNDIDEDGVVTFDKLQPKVAISSEAAQVAITLVTATLTDPDGRRSVRDDQDLTADRPADDNITWVWARSQNNDGPWTDIMATSTRNPAVNVRTRAPEDADVGHFLRATAMYFDGNSPEDAQEFDKSAQFVSDHAVIPADYLPKPPVFLDDNDNEISTTTRQVLESKGPGDAINPPVVATDYGADGRQEVLIYGISESQSGPYASEAGIFVIDDRTGQLSLGDNPNLNYDGVSATTEYTVWVKATDPTSQEGFIDVTVEVVDVNEPPTFTSGATSTPHAEFDSSGLRTYQPTVQTYQASDPEEETNLRWSVTGTDGSRFDIDAGVLTFKSPPDFESPPSRGRNTYRVKIEVSDRGEEGSGRNVKKASLDVQVGVTNVEEGSELTVSQVGVVVNRLVTATVSDPDKFDGQVAWEWSLVGSTSTSSEDNVITFRPSQAGTVSITARYTDGSGNSETETGIVTVVDAVISNSPPEFAANTLESSVQENSPANTQLTGGNVTATDDNSEHRDLLTYTLEGGDRSLFKIDMVSGRITTRQSLDREESRNSHSRTLTVKATDPEGGSDTVTVDIEVTDEPERPTITSGDNAPRHAENDTGVIETYTASDQEDASSDLIWSVNDPTFEINDRGQLKFASEPNYESRALGNRSEPYNVLVQVDDSGGLRATIDVDVILTNVQEAGTVTITPVLQPKVGETNLTAAITDPDDSISDTTWRWGRSRNSRGSFTPIEGATSTIYAPVSADAGNYLQATATYDDAASPEDDPSTTNRDESKVTASEVTRFVVAAEDYENVAPVFQDSEEMATTTAIRMVDENSPEGRDIGLPVAATDLDVNGDQENLSYAFVPGGNADLFTIVEGTGQIRVGPGDPFNYEDPSNSTHQYMVTIRATDPSGLSTDPGTDIVVTIKVVDLEEAPEILEETPAENLSEKDYEEEQATTSEVSLYSASDQEDSYVNSAEDRDEKDLKWSLSGRDMDDFTISTSSAPMKQQLRFKESPSYERPTDSNSDNVYNVTVVVTDSAGRTDTRDVTVTVKNIDEPGTVTLSNLQPEAGIPITATLEDPDGGVTNVRWQWFTADNRRSAGTPIPGADATERTYTPDDVHATSTGGGPFHLRAVATYNDNASVADDPATTDVDEFDHEAGESSLRPAQPKDDMNESPQFTDQDPNAAGKQTTRQIPERVESSGEVVQPSVVEGPVTATDEPEANNDTGEVLTYSMSGPDAGLFTIDRGTDSVATPAIVAGQIRVAEGTELDYETRKTYTVVVTATDPSLATDQITVTIEVTDFNEDPVIMMRGIVVTGDTSVSYPENGTTAVETYSATGADAAGATWSLEGTDAGAFSISSSGGVMTFNASPDFEAPTDQGGNNVYNVTVKATSGTISMSRTVTVTVTNEDEPGTVNISSPNNEVKVGVELTAELDERDEEAVTGWQWASSASDTGPWANISGATDNTYTPVDGDVGNYLQITVFYDQPAPLPSGQTLSEETTTAVVAASTTDNPGTVSLLPSSGLVSGDSATASLADQDNPVNQSWQWARSASANGPWSDISNATSATFTTTNSDAGNYLRATVTYDDSSGTGKTADRATSNRVRIHTYDADADGRIDRSEVIEAIRDYLFERIITREQVIEVIKLYLSL